MTFPKLTVLILEDTPADAGLIADALRNAEIDFDVVQVDQEREFHRLLQEISPDLIFADHSLAATYEQSALAASRRLWPAVPFIFVSDTPGEEAAVEAIRSGATDYVLKHKFTRLGSVVRRALEKKHDFRTIRPVAQGAEHLLCGCHERPPGNRHICEPNQALRALREINKLIVREREPDMLLGGACNILIRTLGYLHAGIGLVESFSQRVPPVTRAARKAGFLDQFSLTGDGDAAEPWPARVVTLSGHAWVCQDTANDPRFTPWRESTLACGCASVAAVPMIHWGRTIGAITVCSDRVDAFPQEDIRWLEEVAGDLAFALESNRQDQARRSAEARLHLLELALQSAATAIVLTDRQGCGLWANPAMTRMTGYPLEEVLGKNVNFFKSGAGDGRDDELLWKTILAGQVWQSETVNRRKDGSLYTEECTITPVRDETGEVAHFIAVKQDITDRKRDEETLRWRTTFFEALVDSNLDGILVVDSHGRKILQNRRMCELWKIPPNIADDPDDAKQVEFVKARTVNPRPFARRVAHLYAHTDEISREEVELTDGMILDRYTSPVRDKKGTYYGRIWTFRDITEQRLLEARFRQAQKMEAIGQLAGGVAHDFNNILAAVMMHLCLLRETVMDPETAEVLLELEAGARRATDLTRQLLMFSRKSTIEVKPIDLNRVVKDMLKMLQRLLGENVSVHFSGPDGLPLVEADFGMMQQVIMNLSVNGRDAMPDGGQLAIATAPAEFDGSTAGAHADRRPGRFVRMSVADTGSGMDDETRKRIFEPFFTTKEIGKGTGLGLATVYGIVQQHRGWIEVNSQPGKGSAFDVFLPVTEKTIPCDPVETTRTMLGGTETILLVEDEKMVQIAMVRGLQMLGYRVIDAADGPMALELWSRHKNSIQLLITDMIMPNGLNGLELAKQLQKTTPDLKVIISSGYSAKINGDGVPSEPGIHFLPKPFGIPQLATAIRACLDPE